MAKASSKVDKTTTTSPSAASVTPAAALPTDASTGTAPLWKWALPASLAIIFVLMTVMSFSYGLSGDEVDMNEYGKAILKYFATFGADQTVFNLPKEFDRDGVMIYYGGFFDLICALANKLSPLGEYATRHMLNAWAGFLAIFFAARIAARLMNQQAAVFCAWLMFLAPFFLGHAMNNPKDVPFATAYIAAIYCMLVFFDHLPRPRIKDYVFLILAIGITIDVRVGGILLLPYILLLGFVVALKIVFSKGTSLNAVIGKHEQAYAIAKILFVPTYIFALVFFIILNYIFNLKRSLIQLNRSLDAYVKCVLVCVTGYLAGSLFWPYGQKNPISNPLTALSEMSNFKVSIGQLFEGEKYASSELPGNFLIKSFQITNSYAWLLGILLCAAFLLAMRKNRKAAELYFILFTGVFPVFYIIYSKANVYHGWRHAMFAFPSLSIAATAGWYYASEFLKTRNFKFGMAVAGLLLLEPAAFIASSFPNTVCYFNGFAGGVKGAYTNYEVDYYYNSVKQDVDYFKANVLPKLKPTDTITIGSNCAHLVIQYLKDVKNVHVLYVRYPERIQKEWDYSIFHIALIPGEEIAARTWISSNTLFTAEVDGCALSALTKRPSYDDLKGFAALKENKVDTAINYFESFLQKDPNNLSMLQMLANIYHQLHRDDLAGKYANRAEQLLSSANKQ